MGSDSYLVIGGSGFLGRHIVEALLARGDKNVSVFDMVQRYFDVPFYPGDITKLEDVSNAIQKVRCCVGKLLARSSSLTRGTMNELLQLV